MTPRVFEVQDKISLLRQILLCSKLEAMIFRQTSWFSWLTAGGSNRILIGAETGIAEILITQDTALILTDNIEAERLESEELPHNCFELKAFTWMQPEQRLQFLRSMFTAPQIASDAPLPGEHNLPNSVFQARQVLTATEIKRFIDLGQAAARAMSQAMTEAKSHWSEQKLASVGADALRNQGLTPEVILVAGEARLPRYRHPVPSPAILGKRAMMVFCAQQYGLVANLTRFIEFGTIPTSVAQQHRTVQKIEAMILSATKVGVRLTDLFAIATTAYAQYGHRTQIEKHHQGGIGGYRPREILATPQALDKLKTNMVTAWNPSIPNAKIEDTFLLTPEGLKNLTFDPTWQTTNVAGIERPIVWEK